MPICCCAVGWCDSKADVLLLQLSKYDCPDSPSNNDGIRAQEAVCQGGTWAECYFQALASPPISINCCDVPGFSSSKSYHFFGDTGGKMLNTQPLGHIGADRACKAHWTIS